MMTANGGPWNWNLFTKGCSRTKCDSLTTSLHPKSCCRLLTYCDANPSACTELPDFECTGSDCDEHNVYLKVITILIALSLFYYFSLFLYLHCYQIALSYATAFKSSING